MKIVLALAAIVSTLAVVPLKTDQPVKRIAFGSCAGMFGAEYPQIWTTLLQSDPDMFIWLGDAIYADVMYFPLLFTYASLEDWEKKYQDMKLSEGYRQVYQKIPVIGTWDDHDYGINNGDKTNPFKEQAKKLFLDFLDEPEDSLRRKRPGVQASYTLGPKGQRVKIILLDNRTFRDPFEGDLKYIGDSFGESQWNWLEEELQTPGDINIIANGIQVIPQDKRGVLERTHPLSADRLLKLAASIPNTILLSGDIHISEIMKTECYDRPVYEITSSGLTHTVYETYGILGLMYNYILQPWTYTVGKRVSARNFALMDITWGPNTKLTFSIINGEGEVETTHTTTFFDLASVKQKPAYCSMQPMHMALWHWGTSFLLFVLPVVLWFLAFVVCLRKYSHSY